MIVNCGLWFFYKHGHNLWKWKKKKNLFLYGQITTTSHTLTPTFPNTGHLWWQLNLAMPGPEEGVWLVTCVPTLLGVLTTTGCIGTWLVWEKRNPPPPMSVKGPLAPTSHSGANCGMRRLALEPKKMLHPWENSSSWARLRRGKITRVELPTG